MNQAIPLPALSTDGDARLTAAVLAQGPKLRAFVRRQLTDLSEVEDIVQDTFLELLAAYRLTEPIEHLAGWLRRVARNRIIDRFRRRARTATQGEHTPPGDAEAGTAPLLESLLAPEASGPEAAYRRERLAETLLEALEELPAAQREVFLAHELEGRSFRALAAETGIALNTLLGRKHDAVRHLRERLAAIRTEFND